ncbi:MAG TPA: conjugative transfer signal peptidase TraF [Stellaceae bacterium]|nr:conjugative transfer signal peptidase TraF [Stellaceae bacterium]
MRRRSAVVLAIAAASAGLALAGPTAAGFRFNATSSMPIGLWRVEPAPPMLHRGDIVTACLPAGPIARLALRRDYVEPGNCPSRTMPLVKPVAATAGDTVRVTSAGISVDGNPIPNSAALSRDAAGRVMHAMAPGVYRVRPGEVWLLSGHLAESFDSRYFGALPRSAVQNVAHPVWVLQ